MANTIPPSFAFADADPSVAATTAEERASATAFSLAAVIAAENFRSMGWRGHHMVALLAVALDGRNHLSGGSGSAFRVDPPDAVILASGERRAWPEDLACPDGWARAVRLLASVLGSRDSVIPLAADGDAGLTASMRGLAMLYSAVAHGLSRRWTPGMDPRPALASAARSVIPESVRFFAFLSDCLSAHPSWSRGEGPAATLREAWDTTRPAFNVPPDTLASVPSKPAGPAGLVKSRRLACGALTGASAAFAASASAALPSHRNPPSPELAEVWRSAGISAVAAGDFSGVRMVTFMRPEDYAAFLASGRWSDLWAGGVKWHSRYSDQPLEARALHDMRLYGKRGTGICHGYLTTCGAWERAVSERGCMAYGGIAVHWNAGILLPRCTFTVEDSSLSPFLLDAASPSALAHAAALCAVADCAGEWTDPRQVAAVRDLFPRALLRMVPSRYLEFQCHRLPTPDDVESVEDWTETPAGQPA